MATKILVTTLDISIFEYDNVNKMYVSVYDACDMYTGVLESHVHHRQNYGNEILEDDYGGPVLSMFDKSL